MIFSPLKIDLVNSELDNLFINEFYSNFSRFYLLTYN